MEIDENRRTILRVHHKSMKIVVVSFNTAEKYENLFSTVRVKYKPMNSIVPSLQTV